MAKFRNIKRSSAAIRGSTVEFRLVRPLAGPITPSVDQEKTVSSKSAAKLPKKIEPQKVDVKTKIKSEITAIEIPKKIPAGRSRRMGIFVGVLFITITLQILLLVSLLYLSPKLIQ